MYMYCHVQKAIASTFNGDPEKRPDCLSGVRNNNSILNDKKLLEKKDH